MVSWIVVIKAYEMIIVREMAQYFTSIESGGGIINKLPNKKINNNSFLIDAQYEDNLALWDELKLLYQGRYQDPLLSPIPVMKEDLISIDEWEQDFLRRKALKRS